MRHGGSESIQHRFTPIDGFSIAIEANFQAPSGSTYLVDYCLTVPNLTVPSMRGRVGEAHQESLHFRDATNNHVEGFQLSDGKLKWFRSNAILENPGKLPGSGSPDPLQFAIAPAGSTTINMPTISVPPRRLVLWM